jgi:hypothetical protein
VGKTAGASGAGEILKHNNIGGQMGTPMTNGNVTPAALSMDITTARDKFTQMPEHLAEIPAKYVWVTRHGKRVFALVDGEFLRTALGDPAID